MRKNVNTISTTINWRLIDMAEKIAKMVKKIADYFI